MCTTQDLFTAAERLQTSSPGDARTIRKAARAMKKGTASPQQIARAKRLAKGVLTSGKGRS